MVRNGFMISSKWIHVRLWCGSLPSYHLLSQDETELEKRISKIYFDSGRFADLRMQIRLKLKELPVHSQSSRCENPAAYWDILELFDEYLPLLLSIQHYHSARPATGTALPYLLAVFPPLFYGLGELSLLADRVVGKQQLSKFCVPVELVLVLCAMSQLHAMHAESQILQGGESLTITSWPRMQHAEISWQSAESFFRWAASYSCEVKGSLEATDPITRPLWRFFEGMTIHLGGLARMCATHRLSTHISGLALTEIRPERLARLGSVCARRALTLLREAISTQSDLRESRLCVQLRWCLSSYEVRWLAVYYQCELNIYQLDANPEIAITFCEGLLKLRIPQLASSPNQQQDAGFSQFAHEIQLKHHTHLTDALDEKKALLNDCRGRFGAAWGFHALEKCLTGELLTIREMEPVFSEDGVEEEESNYASPFLVEVIARNVETAILQAKLDDSESNAADESEIIVTKKSRPIDQDLKFIKKGLKNCHTVAASDDPRIESTPESVKSSSRATALSSGPSKKRPVSATPQSSGWVTMSYGGKLLHFEKSVETSQSKPELDVCQQDFVSARVDYQNDINCPSSRRSKPRPASSPCYLSSKKTPKPHDHNASSARVQQHDTKLWAPTRVPCALCERRFMRSSLPGAVVMKRVYNLRRKWGVIQDSKKFNVASALYGTANVCLLCQEILAYEESTHPPKSSEQIPTNPEDSSPVPFEGSSFDTDAEIARMIHDSIMYRWHQQPPTRPEDNKVQDIAVNKRVRQSSTVCGMKAQNALQSDTNRSAHTKEEFQPWWELDLANYVEVHSVKVYLRDEVSHLYGAARGLAGNPSRHTTGVYPLHISISMKTGVGRDCDDIIASCVSSLCVTEKSGPAVEWLAPHKSRGRFVRIQCEGRAVLHIERVHVYVAKPDAVVRRQHVRQKLQRAAFCASVIATTATPLGSSNRVAVDAEPTPKRGMSALAPRTSKRRGSQVAQSNTPSEPQLASALFFDPERAEKRRVSRLYARFKGLLDARAKYVAPEEETDEEEAQK